MKFCGDFTVKPDWLLGPRKLDYYELMYFPSGTQTEYFVAGTSFVLSEPCITITRPEEEHSCRFDPNKPVRHLFIVFDLTTAEAQAQFGPFIERYTCLKVSQTTPIPTLIKYILRLSSLQPAGWHARVNALIYVIMEELKGTVDSSDSPIDKLETPTGHQFQLAINLMRQNLHHRITVDSIAREIGWSTSYFTRVFTKRTGVSPVQYLNRLRVEAACQLLLQNHYSVKEIAGRLGFENEHYFSRLFKQFKSVSPLAYRMRYFLACAPEACFCLT